MNLTQLEAIVERGLGHFQQAGEALAKIRHGKLYAQTHPTWDDYCRSRWRCSGRHANRLISASEIAKSLGPIGPATESQARELRKLPGLAQRRQVMQAIQASDRPTARQISQVRQSIERLSPAEKFEIAMAAEEKAQAELQKLDREHAKGRIDKLCTRLREIHAALPCAAQAEAKLDEYLAIIRGV
jgi:hypothetical protein